MNAPRLTPDERAAIVAALEAGEGVNATARRLGRSRASVSRVGAAAGLDLEQSRSKKMHAARRDYAQAERLALLNLGFDKARDLLADIRSPQSLQAWTMAVAVMVDKRRLEDGEATARTDVVSTAARDRIAGRLDELASRRDARRVAG